MLRTIFIVFLLSGGCWFAEAAANSFTFNDLRQQAAALAAQPFQDTSKTLPDFLRDLNYDQYQDIRFRQNKTLWRQEGLPFQVQFFSRGFLHTRQVKINVIDQDKVVPVAFSGELFDFGRNKVPDELPSDLGFAGFRLLYPLNRKDYHDEVAVFLGASYFRAVGQNQRYGISARGLAIDTGLPKAEEFPFFKEFWIEKPGDDATEITVYALLDSASVTGAYRFLVKPGPATILHVKTHLFIRNDIEKLGIAPLTSMFLHGELTTRYIDDFRPEVHDSDGLLLSRGNGERLWRPLDNPMQLEIASFQDTNPQGFGLLQRDRDFNNYQDLEAHYQDRPSAWIEPVGEWGKGTVQLIEIPTDAEIYDNIVAFWIPKRPAEAGQERIFEYRLHFVDHFEDRWVGGRALATRIGAGGAGKPKPERRKFVIDFGGRSLTDLDAEAPVQALVSTSSGQLTDPVAQKNPFTGGWRVFFELLPDSDKTANLRCFLKLGQDVLTETWSYRWIAN